MFRLEWTPSPLKVIGPFESVGHCVWRALTMRSIMPL